MRLYLSFSFYDQVMGHSRSEAVARAVASRLREAGWKSLLVGGCVRDLLLGRPAKDFDVATDARPEQVLDLFPGANLVGAQFGVVLVRQKGQTIEVATFRSDQGYQDGRHPDSVDFETDPARDAQRRDFTINALFLDPRTDDVLDFVGGRSDLNHRLIRAVGNPETRFEEDHLRMLRAVRFAARLDFEIEIKTQEAIQRFRHKINRISPERIQMELTRILTEGGARRGFELLDATGLLEELLPEVARMKGVEQTPEFHPEGDVWTHTLMMIDGLRDPTLALAWGVLLHDVGKPPTFRRADRIRFDGHVEAGVEIARNILGRLRFSNEDTEQIVALIANHMRFMNVPRMKDSTLKRFLRLPRFDEHLELHRLDCTSSSGNLATWEFVNTKAASLSETELRPPRLVTGEDLIRAGYPKGPKFREILDAVEDAQLEGTLRDRQAALNWVADHFPVAPSACANNGGK